MDEANEPQPPAEVSAEPAAERMISIWSWAALILGVYGLILLGTGLQRALAPPVAATTQLAYLHADLWWPGVMLLAAAGLWMAGRRKA